MPRPSALLIGNHINTNESSISWKDVLNNLSKKYKIDSNIIKNGKPFPLTYEEIYLTIYKKNATKEFELKKFISEQTGKLPITSIHSQLVNLNSEVILTTNYDHTLETAITIHPKKATNEGYIKESLYSMFRVYKSGNTDFWHIHGSQQAPNTVLLGYEQYSGYLQQIREYVLKGTNGRYKNLELPPLLEQFRTKNIIPATWINFFFTHDIYIIGFNLDFVEMHIWWIINFRGRNNILNNNIFKNEIYYFYPEVFEKSAEAKIDLLKIHGVKPMKITGDFNNYELYYNKICNAVRKYSMK